MLTARDKDGNEVVPRVGDSFIRLNKGSKHQPFIGEITAVQDDKVSVIGRGYLGGMHYGRWWGDFTSLEHVTIVTPNRQEIEMKQMAYTVRACRWGDTETHSYIVGVYAKKQAALNAATTEEDYRGGKYECEVLEWVMNEGRAGNCDVAPKVIKPLPPMNTLKCNT